MFQPIQLIGRTARKKYWDELLETMAKSKNPNVVETSFLNHDIHDVKIIDLSNRK